MAITESATAAAKEIARNLNAIKGEDGTHTVENLTAIIQSHYGDVASRVQCADCLAWIASIIFFFQLNKRLKQHDWN